MTRIQYYSDLHLEFTENKEFLKKNLIIPKGEILLLAGDIVTFSAMKNHDDFFDYLSENFVETYWIPGNHEYYRSDMADYLDLKNRIIRKNVFLSNNVVVEKEGFRLILSTMWTHISDQNQWNIRNRMNDFYVINNEKKIFTPAKYNELHAESLSFIKNELQKSYKGKTIVATHHVPTLMNYPKEFKGDILNEAFAVELHNFIQDSKIDYWIFGHHHENIKTFSIGKTKMLTNQLGYIRCGENKGFDIGKIINI
jgi:predicted phosphohydrolase